LLEIPPKAAAQISPNQEQMYPQPTLWCRNVKAEVQPYRNREWQATHATTVISRFGFTVPEITVKMELLDASASRIRNGTGGAGGSRVESQAIHVVKSVRATWVGNHIVLHVCCQVYETVSVTKSEARAVIPSIICTKVALIVAAGESGVGCNPWILIECRNLPIIPTLKATGTTIWCRIDNGGGRRVKVCHATASLEILVWAGVIGY
jgi:hypothetical protein